MRNYNCVLVIGMVLILINCSTEPRMAKLGFSEVLDEDVSAVSAIINAFSVDIGAQISSYQVLLIHKSDTLEVQEFNYNQLISIQFDSLAPNTTYMVYSMAFSSDIPIKDSIIFTTKPLLVKLDSPWDITSSQFDISASFGNAGCESNYLQHGFCHATICCNPKEAIHKVADSTCEDYGENYFKTRIEEVADNTKFYVWAYLIYQGKGGARDTIYSDYDSLITL